MRRRSPWALELLAYGVVGLAAGGGVAVAMGVSWPQVGLAAGALLFLLLLAVALERSGLMRLTDLDAGQDDRADD